MNLAVLGLPGAGKTIQAGNIGDEYGIPGIGMGNLLPDEQDAVIHYTPETDAVDADQSIDAVRQDVQAAIESYTGVDA
jgi:adenylate kinase family enzyme